MSERRAIGRRLREWQRVLVSKRPLTRVDRRSLADALDSAQLFLEAEADAVERFFERGSE